MPLFLLPDIITAISHKVDEDQIYLRIGIKYRNHFSSTFLLVAAVYLLPIKLVS